MPGVIAKVFAQIFAPGAAKIIESAVVTGLLAAVAVLIANLSGMIQTTVTGEIVSGILAMVLKGLQKILAERKT
jgi:hypothetical protein